MKSGNKLSKFRISLHDSKQSGVFSIYNNDLKVAYVGHCSSFIKKYYDLIRNPRKELSALLASDHEYRIHVIIDSDKSSLMAHHVKDTAIMYEDMGYTVYNSLKSNNRKKNNSDLNLTKEEKEQIVEIKKYCEENGTSIKSFVQLAIAYFSVNKIFSNTCLGEEVESGMEE